MFIEFARKVGEAVGTAQFYAAQVNRAAIRLNPLACGTTSQGAEVRDYPPPTYLLDPALGDALQKHLLNEVKRWAYVEGRDLFVPYDEKLHGALAAWLTEGDPVPDVLEYQGKKAIHRHDGDHQVGPWRYTLEEVASR